MKFDITVKDLTSEELAGIVSHLTGKTAQPEVSIFKAEVDLPDETSADDVTGRYDADNLPWDARIHSSNKKMGSDGKWAKRRGRTDEEYAAVKAEYFPAPAPVAEYSHAAPTPAPVYVAPTPAPTPAAGFVPYAPIPEPVYVAPTPAPAPVTAAPVTIVSILQRIQVAMQTGRMSMTYIPTLLANVNAAFGTQIGNITDITNNQPMIDYTSQVLSAEGF